MSIDKDRLIARIMHMKRNEKVRNFTAVAAHQRNSAGAMGGSPKQNNKRDRKDAKQELRNDRD
jgi:hypothetical protein